MNYDFENIKSRFEKTRQWLADELKSVHTGKASPVVLDIVDVDSYGSKQPVKNVASISTLDARTLQIEPWDKSLVKEIEKGIVAANLGLSVVVDGTKLRATFPLLTQENRQKLAKVLKEKLEEARITIRKEREAEIKKIEEMEKSGELTEDERFRAKNDMQKLVDEYNDKLEEIFSNKEKEITTV